MVAACKSSIFGVNELVFHATYCVGHNYLFGHICNLWHFLSHAIYDATYPCGQGKRLYLFNAGLYHYYGGACWYWLGEYECDRRRRAYCCRIDCFNIVS